MKSKLKEKICYWYHHIILGQEQCPECGTWSEMCGPVLFTGLDEYKCSKCKNFFQK